MKNRIEEIDMIKGVLILFVIFTHAAGFAGIKGLYPTAAHLLSTLGLMAMVTFFILSGYTYSQGNKTVLGAIGKRIKSIIIPYYMYCVPILVFLLVFFVIIEQREINWYLDGVMAVLLQLQSTYIFSEGVSVHEMMYSVFACWFIFQLLVSMIVFIPIYHLIENKNLCVKIIIAILLLGIGAVFYHLNIQNLNGEYFPPVCKMFVLPNVFGIAGILMLGKCASLVNLLDMKNHGKVRCIASVTVSLIIIVIGYVTDDYKYDFPIGKWGAFGEMSYFITPVYGIALMVCLGYFAYAIKKNETIKKILVFFGKNSLDYLIYHFFVVWFVAYAGGFWKPASARGDLPVFDTATIWMHFIITIFITLAICTVVVVMHSNLKDKHNK